MDWVKPKHRARRLKSSESAEQAGGVEDPTASHWLAQLCEENVALLQSSLPISVAQSKRKGRDYSIEKYLNAMLWGVCEWEVAKPSNREYLHDLAEAFGGPADAAHAAKIGKWITQQLPKSSYDPYVALTCAGWLHALPYVGREIPPALWLDVLQSTLTQVDRAWESGYQDGLFPWIVWACEIPLALAKQLSHLGGKDRIVSDTLNRIALILEQTAEDPKPVMSFGAQDLRAVVACLVRSRWAASGVGARKWYPPQRKSLSKLAHLMLQLSDGEGHALLDDAASTRHEREFWAATLELVGSNRKLQLAASTSLPDDVGKMLGAKPAKLRRDKANDASLPKPSMYWESNRIAVMRRSWRELGCRVAVDFSSDVIWLDIVGENGQRVFSGDWDVELKKDGIPVELDVAWEEVCWFTDDDVDYLELECDLEERCKVQRQVMLVREEGMVYVADAVLSKDPSQWELKTHFSLDPRVEFRPEDKSNEATLAFRGEPSNDVRQKPAALLLPLGMPEWRRGTKHQSLVCDEKRVTLGTTSNKNRLYSPMLIALRGLAKQPKYTWRHLTVAEDLAVVGADVAQGYRAQIGKDQWVFYRSLGALKRRSVMGLHLNTEFYAARFLADEGSYEPLVEVNAE